MLLEIWQIRGSEKKGYDLCPVRVLWTADYLLGLTKTKSHPNAGLADLRLGDSMIDLMINGRFIQPCYFLSSRIGLYLCGRILCIRFFFRRMCP